MDFKSVVLPPVEEVALAPPAKLPRLMPMPPKSKEEEAEGAAVSGVGVVTDLETAAVVGVVE